MKLIPLTQGKFAQVDDEDYEYLNQFKWFAHKSKRTFYAEHTDKKGKTLKMHRVILKETNPKTEIDHEDHDGLNNQKYNLKKCVGFKNCHNRQPDKNSSSKYKGVFYAKIEKKWAAAITVHIGKFETENEAALAYNDYISKNMPHLKYRNIIK